MNQEDVLVLLVVFVLGFVVFQMMGAVGGRKSVPDQKRIRDKHWAIISPFTSHDKFDINPFSRNLNVEGRACQYKSDCNTVCGDFLTFSKQECRDGKCHCGGKEDNIMGFI